MGFGGHAGGRHPPGFRQPVQQPSIDPSWFSDWPYHFETGRGGDQQIHVLAIGKVKLFKEAVVSGQCGKHKLDAQALGEQVLFRKSQPAIAQTARKALGWTVGLDPGADAVNVGPPLFGAAVQIGRKREGRWHGT